MWCAGHMRLTLDFHFRGTQIGDGGATSRLSSNRSRESWKTGASWERMYICKSPQHTVSRQVEGYRLRGPCATFWPNYDAYDDGDLIGAASSRAMTIGELLRLEDRDVFA